MYKKFLKTRYLESNSLDSNENTQHVLLEDVNCNQSEQEQEQEQLQITEAPISPNDDGIVPKSPTFTFQPSVKSAFSLVSPSRPPSLIMQSISNKELSTIKNSSQSIANSLLMKPIENNKIENSTTLVFNFDSIKNEKLKAEMLQFPNAPINYSRNNVYCMPVGKTIRSFHCSWCDFKCRWRFEILQHMRCYHAREKPYRCSACTYVSNWKWDVEKHRKKYHSNDPNAQMIEVPDSVLFPDMKHLCFYEINPDNYNDKTNTNDSPDGQDADEVSQSDIFQRYSCQQCPFVTYSLFDLNRHYTIHTNRQPYECGFCDYKSKWKNELRIHQRKHSLEALISPTK